MENEERENTLIKGFVITWQTEPKLGWHFMLSQEQTTLGDILG